MITGQRNQLWRRENDGDVVTIKVTHNIYCCNIALGLSIPGLRLDEIGDADKTEKGTPRWLLLAKDLQSEKNFCL